jgi:hypothetical protein
VLGALLSLDVNGDGKFTAGTDVPLTGSTETFTTDNGVVTFDVQRTIAPNTSENWILTADLAGTASAGETMQVSLEYEIDMPTVDAATSEAQSVTGFPLYGARVRIPSLPMAWTPLAPSGAAPGRYAHTAVYDPVNDRMVVFAGTNGTASFSDLQELDLTPGSEAWSAISPSGGPPPVRNQHTAFYDPSSQRMIVFGGADSISLYNDLWLLSLGVGSEAWSSPSPTGTAPTPRYSACGGYITGGKAFISAGDSGASVNPHLSDFYELDLSGTPAWTRHFSGTASGYSQSGHVGFYHASGNRVVLFGGLVNPGTPTSLLFSVDMGVNPAALATLNLAGSPMPSSWSAGAWNSTDGRYYVWGGFDSTRSVCLSSLYAFDPDPPFPGKWIYVMVPGASPSARCYHSMIFDSTRDRMILFGGAVRVGFNWVLMSDTWVLE